MRCTIVHFVATGAVAVLAVYIWLGPARYRGNQNAILAGSFAVKDKLRNYVYHGPDLGQSVPLETNQGVTKSDTAAETTRNVSSKETKKISLSQEILTILPSVPNGTDIGRHHNPPNSSTTHPSAQPPKVTRNENTPPSVEHTVPFPMSIPFMGDYNCSDTHCTEFLTEEDWTLAKCGTQNQPPQNQQFPGTCHFMNGIKRSPVYLASSPGSGNTWVRGLLEQVTGICTGSIFCDVNLKKGGFNGEHLQGGTVLVTKTHYMLWVSAK